MTIKDKSSGHQYWGQSAQSVYCVLCGGRYPQGLWACNADGSNEYHPHARFTPNGNGVTFSNEGISSA